MASLRTTYELLRDTADAFLDDECPRLGAAIAFYVMLSLAPMLLVVIGLAGVAFGNSDAARSEVVAKSESFIGKEGAQAVEATLSSPKSQKSGVLSTVIGVVTVLIGATGVFAELQDALNVIWKVDPPPKVSSGGTRLAKVWVQIRNRLLSFSVLCGLAFLLLVSLAVNTVISGMQGWMAGHLGESAVLMRAVDLTISVGLATLLFAMIFKILPARKITWGRVVFGAFVTALLFNAGKFVIGLYLGNTAPGSAYGAAGSLVVLLVWVYYSTLILLVGAEFTKVYSKRYGGMPAPEPEVLA